MSKRIWLAGLAVYIMAVAARTSFGVASLDALSRFDISATELSLFTVIQLGVYAGCQIPLGVLLDRFGSRPIIVGGAIILALGQGWLAFAGTYGSALVARVLIGLGDATAYTSVIRLIPQWFPAQKVPLYTQLTSILGQLGQVVSSLPFAMALAHFGWESAFVGLGVAGGIVGLTAAVFIREKETFVRNAEKGGASAFTHPGVWQGFWAHFALGFSSHVFLLLWGVPFMTVNGIDQAVASAVLIVFSISGIIAGPLVARLTSRHPLRREWPVVGIMLVLAGSWAYILTRDRPVEIWEFSVLLFVIALAGSGSTMGFDYARTSVPLSKLGSANGLVNQGAFTAALLVSYVIGVILDARSPDGDYTAMDFRVALSAQFVIILIGLIGFLALGPASNRRYEQHLGMTIEPARVAIERIVRERRADFPRFNELLRLEKGVAGPSSTVPPTRPTDSDGKPARDGASTSYRAATTDQREDPANGSVEHPAMDPERNSLPEAGGQSSSEQEDGFPAERAERSSPMPEEGPGDRATDSSTEGDSPEKP